MKKINIAILEDDEDQLYYIKELINETVNINVVFGVTNTYDFKIKMTENKVDALLLDIKLSGEDTSGIEIANQYKLPVLFISSFTNEYNAKIEDLDTQFEFIVERLRKPYNKEMFLKKTELFYNRVINIEPKTKAKSLFLRTESALEEKIDFESIIYIKTADDSRDKDFFLIGSPFVTKVKNKNLAEISTILPNNFIQINNSVILNIDKIQRLIDKETIMVVVKDKPVELNISNSFKDDFKVKWNKLKNINPLH